MLNRIRPASLPAPAAVTSSTEKRSSSVPLVLPAAGRSRDWSKCALIDPTSGGSAPRSAKMRFSRVQVSLMSEGRGVVLPASVEAISPEPSVRKS